LCGVAAALLVRAESDMSDVSDVAERGAVAAWVHGRAGELATSRRGGVRGTTLRDVLDSLSDAWRVADTERGPYPVLCELPVVPG
jgi:NAD(P)H-hydrate repair Nnr-like enzyme with NAD(P)H-hydrate dehydratase domain